MVWNMKLNTLKNKAEFAIIVFMYIHKIHSSYLKYIHSAGSDDGDPAHRMQTGTF